MRRSFAPSFQSKKNIPVKATFKELPVETQNSARSTSSILDLLNDNKLTSNPSGDFSVARENDQELNIKPIPISYDDDIDGNLPDDIQRTDNGIYNVVWGKLSKKKHKSWEGDGVLEICSDSVVLKDCDGKCLGTKKGVKTDILEEGSRLVIGSKEIELIDLVVGETNGKVEVTERPHSQPSRISTNVYRPHKRPRLSVSKSENFSCDAVKNALIMSTPSSEHQWVHNSSKLPLTDVVVDSFLSNVLRPHQRDGIRFLYDCVLGMKNPFRHHTGLQCPWRGCILADEMGLGKTLHSLVENWQKEFQKWLGKVRISPFVVNQKNKPKDYLKIPSSQVMIISYEMVVRCIEDLKKIPFDLLICDEGHRLKNTIIKTSQVLSKLSFKSRILLTGTPIQNDLQEFYSLIDFVNPGMLGIIFLLSARAGGVGLNLTGASRLILYDSDWNPATDLQAMARIWRDGQKKSVYIYRFLTTGTIEEKIFLRQVSKTGLSGAIVDPHNKNSVKLSMKELRDLFTYHENTLCLTHDLLHCKCLSGENSDVLNLLSDEIEEDVRECQLSVTTKTMESSSSRMNQLNEWLHFSPPFEESILEARKIKFRKHFEVPIVASRQPNCSQEEKLLGEARAAELHNRTGWFVLRRTQAVINKYLPGKREIVVRMYKTAIKFWEEQSLKKNVDGVPHLKVLTAMKKICNHPKLVLKAEVED
ncbi:hypothetical protein J437_LFUL006071, partial [Ladona fulva]